MIDLDRRKPLPANHVFEAHDGHDPTNHFLHVFRDEADLGVYVNFCDDVGEPNMLNVKAMMHLDIEKCEEFGQALLAAAEICRNSDHTYSEDDGGD